MYEEYFSLSGAPFKLNPDPKFFFGSRSHNKAMAYLHYGLKQAEGFIVITGPVGAGKSMLIGHLLDQLNKSNVVAAHLLTSNVEPSELLSHILSAFRIVPEGQGRSGQLEAFEDFLFDQMNRGRRVLLILDEAQNLPRKTLEELRMLSNIDYDGTPLFQVFLVGQPEFRETLSKADMEQLKQRVIASYHLEDLTEEETREYVEHRLSVVGWKSDPAFSDEAYELIHNETKGRPRRINTVCNRIMLYCAIEKRHDVDGDVVRLVLDELADERLRSDQTDGRKGGKKKAKAAAAAAESNKKPAAAAKPDAKPDNVVVPLHPSTDKANSAEKSSPVDKMPAAKAVDKSANIEVAKSKSPASAALEKTEEKVVEAAKKGAEARPASPVTPADLSGASVFDRLRAQRAGEPVKTENNAQHPPAAATLKDVAMAITAASNGEAKVGEPKTAEDAVDAEADIPEPAENISLDAPSASADPSGWRRSVVRSINDTRTELKSAHTNVARLRRQLSDISRRRTESRAKVVASLSRAETLLSEIRDAWR